MVKEAEKERTGKSDYGEHPHEGGYGLVSVLWRDKQKLKRSGSDKRRVERRDSCIDAVVAVGFVGEMKCDELRPYPETAEAYYRGDQIRDKSHVLPRCECHPGKVATERWPLPCAVILRPS